MNQHAQIDALYDLVEKGYLTLGRATTPFPFKNSEEKFFSSLTIEQRTQCLFRLTDAFETVKLLEASGANIAPAAFESICKELEGTIDELEAMTRRKK